MAKPEVRVHFIGDGDYFSPVVAALADEYAIIRDPKNPEFLFFCCVGTSHRRYDCVKIQYVGENMTPDFNWCDYAVGYDYIEFEDRYIRNSRNMRCFPWCAEHVKLSKERDFIVAEAESKTGFCNFIYSNAKSADPIRMEFFEKLSKYKQVDSGGRCCNNIGYFVKDKIEWQRRYKFSIAFENSAKSGYTTEKIIEPLVAHTIPIYWGDPRVCEEFNVNRFINYADYPCMDAVIDRVRELDNDHDQYLNMLSQPWFPDTAPVPVDQKFPSPELLAFVRHIFAQGPIAAKRIPAYGFMQAEKRRVMQESFLGKMRHSAKKRKAELKAALARFLR